MDTFGDLQTGLETWYEVPVKILRKQMRNAYEQRKGAGKNKQEQGRKDINRYSFQNVGKTIQKVLENV